LTDPNLSKSVDELELSVRLANILDNAGRELPEWAREKGLPPTRTLGDVIQWTEQDLLLLRHMGARTLDELTQVLASEGVCLGGASPNSAETRLAATTQIVHSLRGLPKPDQARAIVAAATILGHEDLVQR
jgi:DNA-directed RNA polymerase alpha subunit